MSAFDPSKDKVLKTWKCEQTGLIISINQYAEGQPKLQIGPRIFKRKDGTEGTPLKAGRLSIEDITWFSEVLDEIMAEMSQLVKPE
ncbi:MAG: hypothetical protein HQK77_03650 [Desulfobacterales bacterium]|nr:hypothetical protein [Desulfobacterales bacterium]